MNQSRGMKKLKKKKVKISNRAYRNLGYNHKNTLFIQEENIFAFTW